MSKIIVPGPRLGAPVLEAPPVSNAAAGAYQQAANDVGRLGAALDEKFQADATVNVAEKMTRARGRMSDRLLLAQANGEIEDGFTGQIQDEFDALSGELMESAANNPHEQKALSMGLLSLQGEIMHRALGFEAQAATSRRAATAEGALNEAGGVVFADPSQYEAVYAEQAAMVANFRGPAETKLQLEKRLQGLGESALRGIAERNPAQALKVIDAGAAGYKLDTDRLPAIRNHAQGELTRRTNEVEQEVAKRQTTAALAAKVEIDRWAAGLTKKKPELTPELKAAVGEDNALRLESDLISTEAQRNKQYADMQLVQSRLASGLAIDEKDPQQKRGFDQHYRENFLPTLEGLPAEKRFEQNVAFAATFGAVPDTLKSELRASLRSPDDSTVLEAANLVAALRQASPRLLDGMAKEDLDLATRIQSQTTLGVDPKKAIENVKAYETVTDAQRQVRQQVFKELTTDEDADAALRQATGGEPSWFALLGGEWKSAAEVPAIAREEFKRLRRDEFMRTGNLASADVYAKETMKRTWGLSMMTGQPTVTKYAPERWYGSPNLSASENWEWISNQAKTELGKATGSVPEGSLMLQPHPTRKASDGRPAYVVVIQNPSGLFDVPKGKNGKPVVFVPDLNQADAGSDVKAKQKAKIDAARAQEEFRRRQVHYGLKK